MILRYLLALLVLVLTLLVSGCNSGDLKTSQNATDYFTISEFNTDINETDSLILQKSIIKEAGENLNLYNGINKRFILLKDDNSYLELGNYGRGPLEFGSFTNTHSTSEALYIYDNTDLTLIRYPFSQDEEGREFTVRGQVIEMAVDEKSERILIYANDIDNENVLYLYDFTGKLIKDFYKPASNAFKLFSYVFRNGDIRFKSNRFYFMYPDNNDIVELSTDGVIIDTLFLTDKTPFNNYVPEMPEKLDPFGMTSQHYEYISSYFNPAKFYILKEDMILFRNVRIEYDSAKESVEYISFYNLLERDGEVVFEGLEFGENFRLRTILDEETLIFYDSDDNSYKRYDLEN